MIAGGNYWREAIISNIGSRALNILFCYRIISEDSTRALIGREACLHESMLKWL